MKSKLLRKMLLLSLALALSIPSVDLIIKAKTNNRIEQDNVAEIQDGDLEDDGMFAGGSGTEDDPYLIQTAKQLDNIRLLNSYRERKMPYFKLVEDIDLAEYKNWIPIGTEDNPFVGTFDGDGHVIANLEYVGTSMPTTDTGLFSYTGEGAVIKNLTLKNADIDADYRAGLIAGYSEGTLFENISIVDSHLSLSAANNVLSLITDGGIRGGAIVGEANNSILYNCESINTMVNTNNTSAVSALSGKGLYVGGRVGTTHSSVTEDSSGQGGLFKIYYDVFFMPRSRTVSPGVPLSGISWRQPRSGQAPVRLLLRPEYPYC